MTYTERLPRHKSETEHDPPAAQMQKARTIETHKYLASDADQSDHMYVVEYAKQAMPTYTDRFSKRGFPKVQAQNLQYIVTYILRNCCVGQVGILAHLISATPPPIHQRAHLVIGSWSD